MIVSPPLGSPDSSRDLWLTAALIGIASACLVAGLVLPAIAFERFYFFGDEHSLLSAVWALWRAGEIPLAVIIAVFSVAFPFAKLGLMAVDTIVRLGGRPPHHRSAAAVAWLGRWSMLDVFILALIIVAIRGSGIGDAATRPGIYLFATSVLLTMWAGERLRRTADGRD